jgi:hypothetical protein
MFGWAGFVGQGMDKDNPNALLLPPISRMNSADGIFFQKKTEKS